jgi:hypothetical protein
MISMSISLDAIDLGLARSIYFDSILEKSSLLEVIIPVGMAVPTLYLYFLVSTLMLHS